MKAIYLLIIGALFGSELNSEKPFTQFFKAVFYDSGIYKDKEVLELLLACLILLALFGLVLVFAYLIRLFSLRKLTTLSAGCHIVVSK